MANYYGETAVLNRISRIDLMAKGSSQRDIDLVPQSVQNDLPSPKPHSEEDDLR
jgi:hypothetical protein